VRFFLKEQKRDGWWPVFQATDDQTNASTFGTAWALIGLQTQLRNKLLPQTMEEEGANSDSLSGLIMHALHLTASDSIKQLKKEWLDNLPSKVPAAGDASQSYVWVKLRVGTPFKDDFVQIALPW